jgi:hypothetical protein
VETSTVMNMTRYSWGYNLIYQSSNLIVLVVRTFFMEDGPKGVDVYGI